MVPKDQKFEYYYLGSPANKYTKVTRLKNMLDVVSNIAFDILLNIPEKELIYENTDTCIGNKNFNASFHFGSPNSGILTKSNKSGKITTIEAEGFVLSTLDLPLQSETILAFLHTIGLLECKQDVPKWFYNMENFNDKDLKLEIEKNNTKIKALEEKVDMAKQNLSKNDSFKSILYTNGNELIAQVYIILENILEFDLSRFIDQKKEDFEIEKDEVTFIGEIKGVTSNVKNENVSQLDVHVQGYMDRIKEEGRDVKVKGLLIINSQRNRSPIERDAVGQDQIKLAERNNSLIITTVELLSLYERLTRCEIESAKIIRTFSELSGLFNNDQVL